MKKISRYLITCWFDCPTYNSGVDDELVVHGYYCMRSWIYILITDKRKGLISDFKIAKLD